MDQFYELFAKSLGFQLVVLLRFFVAFTILKWPLAGAVFALITDYFDLNILLSFQDDILNDYQAFDKTLDFFTISIEVLVASFWLEKRASFIAQFFYLYRAVGIFTFLITKNNFYLFLFPNFFEVFFLWFLIYQKAIQKFQGWRMSKLFVAILILAFIYKLYQEYSLHIYAQTPWPIEAFIIEHNILYSWIMSTK